MAASTYERKIINGNDIDNGDLVVFSPKKTFKDRDIGDNVDISNRDTLNSRLDNPQYYTA